MTEHLRAAKKGPTEIPELAKSRAILDEGHRNCHAPERLRKDVEKRERIIRY
jgi:hypothetical protein